MDANGLQALRDQAPVLAGYDAVRRLGCGAQGAVWLVRPADGGLPLAAKCFMAPSAVAAEPDGGASGPAGQNESEITQEWRILARYEHDHLVAVHGLVGLDGPWRGGQALLMDHAAGGSVRDIVAARGPLSVGECVTVLTPLGQVLSFLHGRGVVHGDVSPGNVLMTVHGKPVLGDLGFGRLAGQPQGCAGGTPGFFGRHDDGASPASDVYAMAAVGWFALTGHAPAATRDRMPLGMYVRGVPAELVAALEAGLADIAGQRPTAAELAQAVFRSARAEPVALAQSVHPSVLPELSTRRDARRRAPRFSWHRTHRPRLRQPAAPGGLRGGRRGGGASAPVHSLPPRFIAVAAAVAVAGAGFAGWRLSAGVPGETGAPAAATGVVSTSASAPAPARVPASAGAAVASPPPASKPDGAGAGAAVLGGQAGKIPAPIRDGLLSAAPEEALASLAWVRSYALSNADHGLLGTVNAVGSPAMAADKHVVQALARSGHSYAGLETKVSRAVVVERHLVAGGGCA